MGKRLPPGGRKASSSKVVPLRSAPAAIGDNSMHGEEAERVQLISIVSQLSAADDAIEVAKAPLKAAQKKRGQIIGLGKAAGFTAKELERRLDEMRNGTRQNAELAQREHKHRRWLGILEPDQAALIMGDAAPQEIKDEAHWKGEGYKAGLRQMAAKPPPECPERFVQPWLAEHGRGQTEVLTANAPKKMGVREQAAADFKADNEPEPGSPEAKKAEREAVRRANESLAAMGVGEADASIPEAIRTEAEPAAGFEATADELAAQTPRQAVQAAREGEVDDPTELPCQHCDAGPGEPCAPDCPSDAELAEVV